VGNEVGFSEDSFVGNSEGGSDRVAVGGSVEIGKFVMGA
jgi:hypothetical protein